MQQALKDHVIEALRTVYDPEIPVNIYDLGLIYTLEISPEGNIAIRMTLTAPNCPVAEAMPGMVESRVRQVAGVKDVAVELTFDPPWDRSRMSEAVQLQLGLL